MQNKERFPTNLSLIMYFLQGCKKYFVFSAMFTLLMSALELISPRIIAYTVDSVLGDKPAQLPAFVMRMIDSIGGTEFLRGHLWYISLAVALFALLAALSRFLFRVFTSIGAEKLVRRMRDTLFEQIMHLPFSWHNANHTGDIIQRCTSDVEQIKMFLSEQLVMLVRMLVLIFMALYFMTTIHAGFMLVSAAFIPLVMGYSFMFHHKIGSQFAKVDAEEGRLSSIAQENLTGVRVVRAFGREVYERERFEKQNKEYTGLWIHLMKLLGGFWTSMDFSSSLQMMVIALVGSYLCVRHQITAGNYIAFYSYNMMLIWPVRMLGRVIANLSKAGISIGRLHYIMNSEREHDRPETVSADYTGDIVFDHVSFSYGKQLPEILQDVSFTVKSGTTLGILGGTGSGKSTLMYLLDRLYELPEENGTIRIGTTDIRDVPLHELRSNIGMVLQEPFLFSRSIMENIRIAVRSADIQDVRRAAQTAYLDTAVEHFKEGYETYVGERGVTLSGGQKQRAAIAQTLIRKPPIMIFDDSLSAVDAETDANIRRALRDNTGESTVILIAHRITTLMNADQIIVMDKGRISQMGTHDELIAQDGIYRKIYDLQINAGMTPEEEVAYEA